MFNNIRIWYIRNQVEITWFLIGMLTAQGIDSLSRGNYIGAAVSFGFAYLNYKFSHIRI